MLIFVVNKVFMAKISFPGCRISDLTKIDRDLPLPLLALNIARMHIGVEEVNLKNTGQMVDVYLDSVGLPPGNPWCMSFVFYIYAVASWLKRLANPLPKTGGTLECAAKCDIGMKITPAQAIKDPSIIKPGYLVIWKHTPTTGHVAFIQRVEGGNMITIEGNTNDEGSRDGYEVCERKRPLSDSQILVILKIA